MSRKWMWVLAAFIATILLAYTIYRSEKAEDDRICNWIETKVQQNEPFSREDIDMLYRRYNCIDDKYSMPYRSERFNSLYEKHIKPL